MKTVLSATVAAMVLAFQAVPTLGLGIPLQSVEGRWTPTDVDGLHINALLLTIVPSVNEQTNQVIWLVDETYVLRNDTPAAMTLNLGIPDGWSQNVPTIDVTEREFWSLASVNGRSLQGEVVTVVMNPAHNQIAYRLARRFEFSIDAGTAVHVRLQFSLPCPSTEAGERQLSYPFPIGALYAGSIETGVITVRWIDRMFGFRSNLSSYSLYSDRVMWFVQEFQPRTNLELVFLPRSEVFRIVAESMRCPMPWEIMDRLSEGSMDAIRNMLEPYDNTQLTSCASLPATLLGSVADALRGGLRDLRLEQFAPSGSGISGPIFEADPAYDASNLNESEGIYMRILDQEVTRRQTMP